MSKTGSYERTTLSLFGFWQPHQWVWGEGSGAQASSGDSSGLGELVTQQTGKVSITLVSLAGLWVFRSLIAQSQSAHLLSLGGTGWCYSQPHLEALVGVMVGLGCSHDFVCITGSC